MMHGQKNIKIFYVGGGRVEVPSVVPITQQNYTKIRKTIQSHLLPIWIQFEEH